MTPHKITFAPYDADVKLLDQEVKEKGYVSVAVLIREIVGNWCADQRRDKRLKLPSHHYSQRNAEDYSEVE